MSDTLETNGEDGEVLDPHIREQLRKSREHEQAAVAADARAQAAERRAAFAEVGIPTSGPGKLFRDHYSGDPDPEAVRAAAEEYGILDQGGQAQGNDGLTDEERAAHQRVAGAGTGVPPAGQDFAAMYMQQMREASSAQEVMDIVRRAEAEHPEIGRFSSPN